MEARQIPIRPDAAPKYPACYGITELPVVKEEPSLTSQAFSLIVCLIHSSQLWKLERMIYSQEAFFLCAEARPFVRIVQTLGELVSAIATVVDHGPWRVAAIRHE